MAVFLNSNDAMTTLAGSISNVAVVANLQSGAGALFPNPGAGEYFVATIVSAANGIDNEIVWVTSRTGDTVTMVRAREGTSAQNWSANSLFEQRVTAGQMQALIQLPALQLQEGNYAVDTGAINAYLVALDPVTTTELIGAPLRVLIANTNTGASTLNYGAGLVPIRRRDGSALIGNELIAGEVAEFIPQSGFVQLMAPAATTPAALAAGIDTQSFVTPAQAAGLSPFFAGTMVWAATLSAPAGWLLSYAQDVSRATYSTLFAAITRVANVTISNATPAVVSWTGHGLKIGDRISFETTGGLPTGITLGTNYYVISAGFGANAFQFSATRGGSAVNTSSSGTGTQSCRFNPYGCGNGTTTFTLPEGRGTVPAGIDDLGGSAAGNITNAVNLGAIVGDETATTDGPGTLFGASGGGGNVTPSPHFHDVSTVQATLMLNCFIKT